jgi:hypothetical protein
MRLVCLRCRKEYQSDYPSKYCKECRPKAKREYKANGKHVLRCHKDAVPIAPIINAFYADRDSTTVSREKLRDLFRRVLPTGDYAVMATRENSTYAIGAIFAQNEIIETLIDGFWERGIILKGPGGILRITGEGAPQRLERWCLKCNLYRHIADFYTVHGVLTPYCMHCTPRRLPRNVALAEVVGG